MLGQWLEKFARGLAGISEGYIPYGPPGRPPGNIDAVATVLRSDWLTQGPAVPRSEEAVAARCARSMPSP